MRLPPPGTRTTTTRRSPSSSTSYRQRAVLLLTTAHVMAHEQADTDETRNGDVDRDRLNAAFID
jgi:hypothetical protein